jgi:hypothetical protein
MHQDVKTRTTVTIDREIFDLVRKEAAQTGQGFADVLNERLRASFSQTRPGRKAKSTFRVKPFETDGFAPGIDENKLNQLLDTLESDQKVA